MVPIRQRDQLFRSECRFRGSSLASGEIRRNATPSASTAVPVPPELLASTAGSPQLLSSIAGPPQLLSSTVPCTTVQPPAAPLSELHRHFTAKSCPSTRRPFHSSLNMPLRCFFSPIVFPSTYVLVNVVGHSSRCLYSDSSVLSPPITITQLKNKK
jgi:hypothetical protein